MIDGQEDTYLNWFYVGLTINLNNKEKKIYIFYL